MLTMAAAPTFEALAEVSAPFVGTGNLVDDIGRATFVPLEIVSPRPVVEASQDVVAPAHPGVVPDLCGLPPRLARPRPMDEGALESCTTLTSAKVFFFFFFS